MKLKPCPVCKGDRAHVVYCGIYKYFAHCPDCGAGTYETATRGAAAELWNEGDYHEKRRS